MTDDVIRDHFPFKNVNSLIPPKRGGGRAGEGRGMTTIEGGTWVGFKHRIDRGDDLGKPNLQLLFGQKIHTWNLSWVCFLLIVFRGQTYVSAVIIYGNQICFYFTVTDIRERREKIKKIFFTCGDGFCWSIFLEKRAAGQEGERKKVQSHRDNLTTWRDVT